MRVEGFLKLTIAVFGLVPLCKRKAALVLVGPRQWLGGYSQVSRRVDDESIINSQQM